MKKMLKGLLAVVVAFVLVVVIALAAHPLWVGSLVKSVAESVGPKYTGTPVELESCAVNLYTGHVELNGFRLANPAGCSEDTAAGVGSLKVDLDTMSAMTDVINIRSIEVSGVFASYVQGASGKYNFTEIADNAKTAAGEGKPEAKAEAERPKSAPEAEKESSGKKVIIERLSVGNVRVSALGVKLTLLPGTIVLTDIGKKSNGATVTEAWDQIYAQVMSSSGAAGKQLAAVLQLGTEYGQKGLEYGKKGLEYGQQGVDLGKKGLDAGTEGAKKALDSVKNLDVEGAQNAIKDAGESLKDVGKGLKGLFGN